MFVRCELVILMLVLTLDTALVGGIIGGHKAVVHSRPYMVLLERHMQDGKTKYSSGFLLNEDFVMTAAHCQASSYVVLLGVHNVRDSAGKQNLSVEKAYPHENFGTDFKNDIMLLKLSFKAKIGENVRPIALADEDDGSLTLPKSCIISGWGKTNMSKKFLSPILMEANVTLINSDRCDQDNLYCSDGPIGPGNGDSGIPLVCEDGKAYGLASFKYTPNSGGPVIYSYTMIPYYRRWIDSTMKNALSPIISCSSSAAWGYKRYD